MKLYEIDTRLSELLLRLDPDPETGEVICDDELLYEMEMLGMERMRILTYLAQEVLNTRSNKAALEAETDRLKARIERLKKREERLIHILDRECAGVKTDLGIATVSYRRGSHLEITDPAACLGFLMQNGYNNCLLQKKPEIAKKATTALLMSGVDVPGCHIQEKNNCSLK